MGDGSGRDQVHGDRIEVGVEDEVASGGRERQIARAGGHLSAHGQGLSVGQGKTARAGIGKRPQIGDQIGTVEGRPAGRRAGKGRRGNDAGPGLVQGSGGIQIDRGCAHRSGDGQGGCAVLQVEAAGTGIAEVAQIGDLVGVR